MCTQRIKHHPLTHDTVCAAYPAALLATTDSKHSRYANGIYCGRTKSLSSVLLVKVWAWVLFGNNSRKPDDRSFTGRRRHGWHAFLQTLGAFSVKRVQNGSEKAANFVKKSNASFHHSPAADFLQFENKMRIGIVMNSFGTKMQHFSTRDHLLPPQKKLIFWFFGILRHIPLSFACRRLQRF